MKWRRYLSYARKQNKLFPEVFSGTVNRKGARQLYNNDRRARYYGRKLLNK